MRRIFVLLLACTIITIGYPTFTHATVKSNELESYLEEISTKRGITFTKEDLEDYLNGFGDSLTDYSSINELKEVLGEVINADLSNLNDLYHEYDLTEKKLNDLLTEYGEELSDYIFLDDLEIALIVYSDEDLEVAFEELFEVLFQEFDLTPEELDNLIAHFESLETHFSNEQTLQRLENLAYRMIGFTDFDMVSDLTESDIAELLAIYNEFLDLFQLKATYHLMKDGTEKELSLTELMNLTELTNAKLKISFYNLQGNFLADIILTGEMVNSNTIHQSGNDVKKIQEISKTEMKNTAVKTPKGAKLPKTASDYGSNMLIGLAALFVGVVVYRKTRKMTS
ncbi:processed acidic surface protein [Pseudogracilibacillus auburnensis]|uniref:Processed acidic surface protein n=1 Tax=Pseudogracilibacillus auburnensis TaxID=1494959 RepID=A0A2V3VVN7_9BACI|nr:processed acidic surface protein [Pseudogracilibacillus auburnensis]MBO1004312.1 processed acidic surface protein [Pseudogracilibacillus auburnensis]PXW85064.1 processed acidic surface protein [Pseudogracilibacillus auburnensis]